MLTLIVTLVVGVVTGVVVALRVIAPATKTKKDDELLVLLEKYGEPVVKEVAEFLAKK